MTDDPFGNLEFASGSDSLNSEEFIDIVHDPDILYYHIKDAHEKAQQDLTINAGDKAPGVKVHAKVEVFQSAIQYVEAFGIYLLAYIKGRETFLDDLIKITPGEVETLFKHLQDDQIDDWLDTNDIDEGYQTLLETLFGYLYLDQDSVSRPDGDDVTEVELKEIITASTNAINHELESIGEFYTTFHDIYNAVKHGNRAIPQTEIAFQIAPSDGAEEPSADVDLDMNFVLFVCKNNNGEPYLTGLPIDYLLEHTLAIVEKTHDLFTHLKTVSHAIIKEEPFNISFFTYSETNPDKDDPTASDWVLVHNPNGIIILPRTEDTAALQSGPTEWNFAGRLELDGNTLIIKTQDDDNISNDYPIQNSFVHQDLVGLTPQSIVGLTLNFTINDLDALQYYELLQVQDLVEENSLHDITVIDERTDTEFPVGIPNDSLDLDLEDFLIRERMEQIALLQKITQRKIPVPLDISEEQCDVIDECIQTDLTRDEAIEAVEILDQLGTNREFTEIIVEKMTLSRDVINAEYIDIFPGTVDITLKHDEMGEIHSDEVKKARLPTRIIDITFDELVESFRTDPDTLDAVLNQIPQDLNPSSTPSKVYVHSRRSEPGFWSTKHKLRIEVIDKSYGAHPPIRCQLCGEATMDFKQHLLEGCSVVS